MYEFNAYRAPHQHPERVQVCQGNHRQRGEGSKAGAAAVKVAAQAQIDDGTFKEETSQSHVIPMIGMKDLMS